MMIGMRHCLRALLAGRVGLKWLAARSSFRGRVRGIFSVNTGSGSNDEFLRASLATYLQHVQCSEHITFNINPWVLYTCAHACTRSEIDQTIEFLILELVNN